MHEQAQKPPTEKTETVKYLAETEKKHGLSPIWFLPIIAGLLGLWIVIQNIAHSSESIIIHFDTADAIIVDKTKLRYKGVIIGTVKKVELDVEGGVNITAKIESHATFMLRKQTKFWLVSPKASLTNISGLDTIFSGSYINVLPGDGAVENEFIAAQDQPILVPDNALRISMKKDDAGAIDDGTPIFYKKIKVGEVSRVRLDESGEFVDISAFINKQYKHLVKEETKFWNISGLSANISAAGVDIKLESLTALIAGGITFSSPKESKVVTSDKTFKLFDNIDKAEAGVSIELVLDYITNLPTGAGIIYKGLGIGRITKIRYSLENEYFIAEATINPEFNDMITKNAQFWVEKTSFSFSNIKNLGNVITGDYIGFSPEVLEEGNVGEPATKFVVQSAKSPSPDAHEIVLLTKNATGISVGNSISYLGIKIGRVSKLSYSEDGRFIEIYILIDKQYEYLVNKKSQFFLLSGVNVKASLTKGLEVQTTPFEQMVSGGIGLYNPSNIKKNSKAVPLDKDQRFRLYPSREMAKIGRNVFSAGYNVSVLSKLLPSVSEGSPVYYHKFPIGKVVKLSIDKSGLMRTKINIDSQYKHLINRHSVFWNTSGISITGGLSGIKVETDSLLSIAAGGISVDDGRPEINNRFKDGAYKLFANRDQATEIPHQLTLIFDLAYDLKEGSQIRLKGLVIGEINSVKLNENNKVEATANIKDAFAEQVLRENSRFWIIKSDLSLSGAKHLSTLISGVYINVQPGKGNKQSRFEGESDAPVMDTQKIGLPIIMLADNAGSTDIGSPVYYRQIQIGEVTGKKLVKDTSGVEISLNIYPKYRHIIRTNSIFWPASGFNLDIGITGASLTSTSLTSLIKGGISMSTPDDEELQPEAASYQRFNLKKEMNEAWLKWKLAIPQ
jgi:paraquat-inducible protein B